MACDLSLDHLYMNQAVYITSLDVISQPDHPWEDKQFVSCLPAICRHITQKATPQVCDAVCHLLAAFGFFEACQLPLCEWF